MEETGWLIELIDPTDPKLAYWSCPGWTSDPNLGIRFARQHDGQVVANNLLPGQTVRVADHMWADG